MVGVGGSIPPPGTVAWCHYLYLFLFERFSVMVDLFVVFLELFYGAIGGDFGFAENARLSGDSLAQVVVGSGR